MAQEIVAKPDSQRLDAETRRSPSALRLVCKKLFRRPPALFGLSVIILALVLALVPGLFAPLDPLEQDLTRFMQPPGFTDTMGQVTG